MSSLDKMSIMGIRSFAPDSVQVVQFFSPLTLILGLNGTGKTTIIESLRYVTTGDMPPNSGRGSAFIHDPKIAHEVEVKAQIKLKFVDATGKGVTTTRSLIATQKQKRMEVRSLDGTILRKGENGKDASISSKCAELDREMVACLGVSKAILNNVIFCHQEDSNWPLSEGKALKTKFDEIFAATRYIKALDNFHKIRLEHDNCVKLYSSELKFLEQNKMRAAELRADMGEAELRLTVSHDMVRRVQEKLKPIERSLEEINKKERDIFGVQTQITSKETELTVELKGCRGLESKIVNEFKGSDEELKAELRNFDQQLDTKKDSMDGIQHELVKLNKEIPRMASERSNVLLSLGKLRTEADQHRERVARRDRMVEDLGNKYGLTSESRGQKLSESKIQKFQQELDSKIELLISEHQSIKDSYAKKEQEWQKKLINSRDSKTKAKQTEDIRTKQINIARKSIQSINMDLSLVEAAAPRLQIIEAELKQKEKELQDATNSLDASAKQSEIDGMQREIATMDSSVRQLDAELMRLHNQTKVRAEWELAKKNKLSREETICKLKSKHEDTIMHLLGAMPKEKFCDALKKFTVELSRDIRKLRISRDKLKVEIASNESDSKMLLNELQQKENEISEYEEQMLQTCGSRNLESGLGHLRTSIKNLQDENGALTGTSFLYNKFIDKLKQKEACCPICHRSFNDQQDVDDLVEDLNMKLHLLPREMEAKQKSLQEQQEKYNSMLELKPVKSRVELLSSRDIPELKAKVKSLEGNVEKARNRLTDVDDMLNLKEADDAAAQSMQADLVLLEQNISEFEEATAAMERISRKLGNDAGRTTEQVSKEKSDLQSQLDTLQASLRKQQKRLNEHTEMVNGLQVQINSLGAEQLQISRDMQRVSELENRRTELTNEVSGHRREIEDIQKKLLPLEKEIAVLEKELDATLAQRDEEIDESQRKINEIRGKAKELVDVQLDISKYTESRRAELLVSCQKELDKIDTKLNSLEAKKRDFAEKLQQISKDIDNQEMQARDLKDSLELRTKQKHIEGIRGEIRSLRDQLGGFDVDTMHSTKKSLQKQEEALQAERHKAEGGQRELEESISRLKRDLANSIFCEADKRYKEKLIQLKTTKVVCKDVQKYSSALDGAIMQYHSLKMKEINMIVRDLWNTTYRGNDIDFIEIRSDVDDTSAAASASASGRRKQYRYRVVMIKGDVEQDMRGRCSAGQKVLASLIIRLALAETFCLNCGILALDEPTTNLDRSNIESLAEALVRIVGNRSQQRNFQLIVITHDEDFLEILGRSDVVEYYYRVSKNDKGNSVVKKCLMQAMP